MACRAIVTDGAGVCPECGGALALPRFRETPNAASVAVLPDSTAPSSPFGLGWRLRGLSLMLIPVVLLTLPAVMAHVLMWEGRLAPEDAMLVFHVAALLVLSVTAYLIPAVSGYGRVCRRLRSLGLVLSGHHEQIAQVAFRPRQSRGLSALIDNADDYGILAVESDRLIYRGAEVEFILTSRDIKRLEFQSDVPGLGWLLGQSARLMTRTPVEGRTTLVLSVRAGATSPSAKRASRQMRDALGRLTQGSPRV